MEASNMKSLQEQQVALATAVADLNNRTKEGLKACDHEVFKIHQRFNAMDLRIRGVYERLDRTALAEEEAYQRRQTALRVLALVLLFTAGVLAGVLFS
jgi:hypothetical protein